MSGAQRTPVLHDVKLFEAEVDGRGQGLRDLAEHPAQHFLQRVFADESAHHRPLALELLAHLSHSSIAELGLETLGLLLRDELMHPMRLHALGPRCLCPPLRKRVRLGLLPDRAPHRLAPSLLLLHILLN